MRSRRLVGLVALILAAPLSLTACGGQPSGVTAGRVSPASVSRMRGDRCHSGEIASLGVAMAPIRPWPG